MIVCDNSSLFEINLGWKLLAASHHRGWEKKALLPLENRSVYFGYFLRLRRLALPAAEGVGRPGGRAREGGLIFSAFARMRKRSMQVPQHGLSPLPTPDGCSKRSPPHQIQGTNAPRVKDQAGRGAPKAQGLAGDHHRHWPPWLGRQGWVGEHLQATFHWLPDGALKTRAP